MKRYLPLLIPLLLPALFLGLIAASSGCATAAPAPAPTKRSPRPAFVSESSEGRCLDMLAVACIHAETCGSLTVPAKECFETLGPQCAGMTGVTQQEATTCIDATFDAPCSVVLAPECEGVANADPPEGTRDL